MRERMGFAKTKDELVDNQRILVFVIEDYNPAFCGRFPWLIDPPSMPGQIGDDFGSVSILRYRITICECSLLLKCVSSANAWV